MAVTIYDVARYVGVSVKTVSRAINDHPDVSPSTRASVMEATRLLGFRPNPLARGLSVGSTGMIGVIVPEILNPHYAEWARSMQELARSKGYMLVLSDAEYDATRALDHLRAFIAHRVEGLIWMLGTLDGEALTAVRAAGLPTVVGEAMAEGPDHIRAVRVATPASTYGPPTRAAVEHLLELGHERIAYITEQPDLWTVRARLEAFQQTLADHGVAVDPGLLRTSTLVRTNKLEGGYRAARALLDERRQATAICTSSDLVAIGIMRALRESGLQVPRDVSVVGCDDLQLASYTDPPLTTIHTPYDEITAANFQLLLHMIDPAKWPEPVLTGAFSLIVRTSTGPAPRQGRVRQRRAERP